MKLTLNSIRYLLVIFSFLWLLIEQPIEQAGQIVIIFLLTILLIKLRGQARIAHSNLIYIEIIFFGWLWFHFGGILYLLFTSTLISCFLLKPTKSSLLYISLPWIAMNAGLTNEPFDALINPNILYLTTFGLLYHIQQSGIRKEELESLYDQLRHQHFELDQAQARLIEYAHTVEELAQEEERNRISHEIHDELGHRLIRLKLMMEAALQIYSASPSEAMTMMHTVRDQLTSSMETLRQTVRRLKPEELNLNRYSLINLIESLQQDHEQLHLSYQITGARKKLYPSEEMILYRNVQEAITNAIKHGQATEIHVELSFFPRELHCSVTNNGLIPDQATLRTGLGLSGMKERAQLQGGRIEFKHVPHFCVTTVLPNQPSSY